MIVLHFDVYRWADFRYRFSYPIPCPGCYTKKIKNGKIMVDYKP
jgi:hypothetical protein